MRYEKNTTRPSVEVSQGEALDRNLDRARKDVDAEFMSRTHHAGDVPHAVNPPLEVEEALNPELDWGTWKRPAH